MTKGPERLQKFVRATSQSVLENIQYNDKICKISEYTGVHGAFQAGRKYHNDC